MNSSTNHEVPSQDRLIQFHNKKGILIKVIDVNPITQERKVIYLRKNKFHRLIAKIKRQIRNFRKKS